MKWFEKKRQGSAGLTVQTREGARHPFGAVDAYVPLGHGEIALYRAIREAVPLVDAAVGKLIRLTGGVKVTVEEGQKELNQFLRTVPTGRGQRGLQSFLDTYLDSMLVCGRGVGEMVADLDIPAGTVCATAGMTRFETTAGATLKAGETSVLAPARAVEPGEGGNVPAGSILAMAVPPVGVGACVNPEAFSGGADAESDDALRTRVLETYRRMPNGANAAFYEQGALSFAEVAACAVLPRKRGKGTVDVVVASTAGAPGEALLAELQDYFDQRREIAVDVLVKAPTPKPVAVGATIAIAEGADAGEVQDRVEKAMEEFFSGALLGQDVPLARLNQMIFSQEGVANCKITAPTADQTVQPGELLTLSGLTLEVEE